uniref:lysis system i-spanin subunit Rz n=1 Tax=Klebsiella michiganensis TaxID=1134687 RepID=UPI0035BF5D51
MEYEQIQLGGHMYGVAVQGDAFGPRLTDSAERDYFTLRERITTITGQVSYLQEYISKQCLR